MTEFIFGYNLDTWSCHICGKKCLELARSGPKSSNDLESLFKNFFFVKRELCEHPARDDTQIQPLAKDYKRKWDILDIGVVYIFDEIEI
jgi:hypothetical protein